MGPLGGNGNNLVECRRAETCLKLWYRLEDQMISRPLSPCKELCTLDTNFNFCTGCGRTLGEIAEWGSATASRQLEIVRRSSARMGSKASHLA
jgi:uncharacterized protein